MDKVFNVELGTDNRRYCELDLPATPYELLDALEKLQIKPGDQPRWEFIENTRFHFLHVHLTDECNLYQLNALATRLGELDSSGRIAFEGLFNQELAKKYGPITIEKIIDLAYSTDCCHVVEDVNTLSLLGEFYAESGLMPELDNLPDCVYQLLDFKKLGDKMQTEDGGILVNRGYVSPQSDLKQVYDTLTLIPKKPDYVFSLTVGRYPFETNGKPENPVRLDLPATPDELVDALNACGAASWEEAVFEARDSAIPHILDELDCDGIDDLNKLAKAIQSRQERSELPKLKAVLHAADCHNISTATFIAENLDDYIYEVNQRSPEEVGLEELRYTIDSEALKILQKHVNLYAYGNDVMELNHSKLTPYGLVERRDGEMQMFFDEKPTQGGMQMM